MDMDCAFLLSSHTAAAFNIHKCRRFDKRNMSTNEQPTTNQQWNKNQRQLFRIVTVILSCQMEYWLQASTRKAQNEGKTH